MFSFTTFMVLVSTLTPALASPVVTPAPTAVRNVYARQTTSAAPYCEVFQDPDNCDPGYCECSDGGSYSFATGTNACPYTSPPPASLTITSTATCSSASATVSVPAACTSGSVPDSSCFDALDLSTYINDWWSANEGSCGSYAGFGDCWYGLETPYAPSTCGELNALPACRQPVWVDFPTSPEKFYVSTHGYLAALSCC